jgi:hypothetical protein
MVADNAAAIAGIARGDHEIPLPRLGDQSAHVAVSAGFRTASTLFFARDAR